jgi:hypothetical protein
MEVKGMRRLIVLLALAFTLVLLPAGMANAKEPLKCGISITLIWNGGFYWDGTITGDITGTFIIAPDPVPPFPGKTEHFLETWVISTATGEIGLYQEGVWNMKTGRWRSNGIVTSATGDWTYLIGCNAHVRGVTEVPVEPGMTGEGRLKISGFRQENPM